MSIAVEYDRDEEWIVTRVVLVPAFERAPGRAHGGIVDAVFDENMGAVSPEAGTLAFTGTLTIIYRAPAPIDRPLRVQSADPIPGGKEDLHNGPGDDRR